MLSTFQKRIFSFSATIIRLFGVKLWSISRYSRLIRKKKTGLRDRLADAELQNLHILIGIVHHTGVSCPRQPWWDRRRQITTQKLRRKCVERGRGDAHLQIQAASAHEEPDTL